MFILSVLDSPTHSSPQILRLGGMQRQQTPADRPAALCCWVKMECFGQIWCLNPNVHDKFPKLVINRRHAYSISDVPRKTYIHAAPQQLLRTASAAIIKNIVLPHH